MRQNETVPAIGHDFPAGMLAIMALDSRVPGITPVIDEDARRQLRAEGWRV